LLFASDFVNFGSFSSSRNVAQLALLMFICGLGRVGSSLPVLDLLHLGSTTFLRSFVRMELLIPVLDYSHLELLLSLQNSACMGLVPSICGLV
jgi:hypothetical protein